MFACACYIHDLTARRCPQLTHGIKSEVDGHHRVLDNLVRLLQRGSTTHLLAAAASRLAASRSARNPCASQLEFTTAL